MLKCNLGSSLHGKIQTLVKFTDFVSTFAGKSNKPKQGLIM